MVLLSPIVDFLVIGGIAGYFTGYFIKRLLHLALTIGVFAFVFIYLAHMNAIDLNLEELGATVTKYADVFLGRLGFAALVSSLPFVGSFGVGFVLGLQEN
jgi:uncharacterized membrane protein (Fun14 family)